MSQPLDDAFNMEVLEPRERATSTGIEIAVGAAVSSGAVWLGARLLASGDYTTPFIIMATFYLVATLIYWRVFRPLEQSGERPTTERLELAAGRSGGGLTRWPRATTTRRPPPAAPGPGWRAWRWRAR